MRAPRVVGLGSGLVVWVCEMRWRVGVVMAYQTRGGQMSSSRRAPRKVVAEGSWLAWVMISVALTPDSNGAQRPLACSFINMAHRPNRLPVIISIRRHAWSVVDVMLCALGERHRAWIDQQVNIAFDCGTLRMPPIEQLHYEHTISEDSGMTVILLNTHQQASSSSHPHLAPQ